MKLLHLRSSVAAKVPTAAEMVQGQIAINDADGKLFIKKADNSIVVIADAAASSATVSSVALTAPTDIFDVTGSPITTTGTLAVALKTQAKNLVFVGPATGADAAPTFRALVAADLPIATDTAVGAVKKGTGIDIAADGTISTVNNGTVTSVGLTVPSILTVAGSPVTGSGSITVDLATEAKNLVFAGPAAGADAKPTFRALTTDDIPVLTPNQLPTELDEGTY
jgi:hypothetical protein